MLYCVINLKWGYDKHTLDISMQGYIKKILQKYNHTKKYKPQHTPYQPVPRKYRNYPKIILNMALLHNYMTPISLT